MNIITKKTTNKRMHLSPISLILLVLLVLYAVSLVLPLVWAFYTSLKTRLDYIDNPLWLPKKYMFSNYVVAVKNFLVDIKEGRSIRTVGIIEMLINSLLFAVGSAFITTFVSCVMAYCSAKFKFVMAKMLYYIVLFTMSLPIVGSLPAELQLAKTLGVYDSMIGMWVMKFGFLNMYFLVFYAMFKGIPIEFNEAASIDGASNFGIFFRIMLPLASSTFATIMLIMFIAYWNDYATTIAYMPSYPTLAYGLYVYSFSAKGAISSSPMKLAGSFVLMLPVLTLFLVFHKKIMGNMLIGGIKG